MIGLRQPAKMARCPMCAIPIRQINPMQIGSNRILPWALSVLLETAQQERSMLLTGDKRLLREGYDAALISNQKGKLWDFWTDSYQAQMHVYLTQTSREMHMNPDVFGLSNTSPYIGIQWWCGDDEVDLTSHILMRCWAQHLRPDSKVVWLHHTYSIWPSLGTPKKTLYCTEYNWPTTLAPTNEESVWAQWGKNLVGKK